MRITIIVVALLALIGGAAPASARMATVARAQTFPTSSECGHVSARPTFATWTNVVVIAFENNNYSTLSTSASDPYFRHLSADCGQIAPAAGQNSTTGYHGVQFPSLPNYLATTGGEIPSYAAGNGIKGRDCTPSLSTGCFSSLPSIFSQLGPTGWYDYTGGMYATGDTTTPNSAHTCELKNSSKLSLVNTLYAARHNPGLYYDTSTVSGDPLGKGSGCSSTTHNDVALPAFSATGPPPALRTFTWISPNICDDGHSPTYTLSSTKENQPCPNGSNQVANIDHFLQTFLPSLLKSSAYTSGNEAIFLWFDSPSGSNTVAGTPIPLVVLSEHTAPGTVLKTGYYNHYDLLRTIQDMVETSPSYLGHAATGHDFRSAFNLCNTTADASGGC